MSEMDAVKNAVTLQSSTGPAGAVFPGKVQAAVRSLLARAPTFTVRQLNALLVSLIVIFVYFAGVSISDWRARLADIRLSVTGEVPVRAAGPGETLESVPYAVFKKTIEGRDIFRMGAGSGDIPDVVSSEVSDAAKNLRLAGISWSAAPDAMIEDISGQKTYVVRKGQQVKNFTVEEIRRDKVILRLGQELVELR